MGLTVKSIGIYGAPVFDSASPMALAKGIAHLPDTSLPWSPTPQRNVYLAGHRHNLTRRSFKLLLNQVGLPQIRFHDLWHTCATLLLARNVNPKIVSEMLGHSSRAITLENYSHVLPNMRDQAAAMEETLV